MIDISNSVKATKDNRFKLSEDIAANKDVKFTTKWKGKDWYFEGYVSKDKTHVHIMLIKSLSDRTGS